MNPLNANADNSDDAAPDEEDHTVMVDRVAAPDEEDHTVMVDRVAAPDEEDHTVMVDRVAAPQSATPQDSTPDDEDHTVMVDRVAAPHSATPQDSTPDDEDHTIVVGRPSNGAAKPQRDKPPLDKPSTARRRSGLTPPPVPAGFAPQAVEAAGANATESYRPRAIPEPPPAPVILQGPDSTREASATMPSVSRHSRITARVAIVVFVTSCVASVVGLTLMALTLL